MKLNKLSKTTMSLAAAVGPLAIAASTAQAATIAFLGSDTTTNTEWRSTNTAKNALFDPNGDNAYGNDGYLIAQTDSGGAGYLSSLTITQTAGGSESQAATLPSNTSGVIEYVFFEISASSGDSFDVSWAPGGNNGIGGVAFEAVPEPTTTALLGLGGLALILRRRK
jgi:hypothetical protein